MKEVKYNPFGSTSNEYVYNAVKKRRATKSKARWWIIVPILALLALAVGYGVTYAVVSQMRSDVEAKIDEFNLSLASVHDTFSDPALPQELRDAADKAQEIKGEEDRSIKSTRILSNVIGSMEDSVPEFDRFGNRDEEALKVAPYYAMCDLSSYSLDVDSLDYRSLCAGFADTAQKMMGNIRQYNAVAGGIIGTLTFQGEKFTDIMNQSDQLTEDLPDANSESLIEPEQGELPPEG